MKKISLTVAGLALGIIISFAQQKEEKELIIKSIREKESNLEVFILKGMTDSIAKIFSPNSHYMPEYGEIGEGRDEVLKWLNSVFRKGLTIKEFKMDPIEQRVYDDIILELGTFTVKYASNAGSSVVTRKYNYLINWKASKKKNYRIRAVTWNSIKAPAE
jgi:hypothetical protein